MDAQQAYIAVASCGCIKMAAIDNPAHRKDVAREVAACIRDGLEIRRVDIETIKGISWYCVECLALMDQTASARAKRGKR